jgi:hypothetical protein
MPDTTEYNPNILGFIEGQGPVVMSLRRARETFGRLPSEYHFVSRKKGRNPKKGLNLVEGKVITEILKNHQVDLKEKVHAFFCTWHRDYQREFGVNLSPFFNLNSPLQVQKILRRNQEMLQAVCHFDIKTEVLRQNLIRKDILHSISGSMLYPTIERMLKRKRKDFHNQGHQDRVRSISNVLNLLCARRVMDEGRVTAMRQYLSGIVDMPAIYADEIAETLFRISKYIPLDDMHQLCVVRGTGVEFQWASRDYSYLALGKITGDCTADKSGFQADRDIENIYWTVFPWILDRNYQILKVFYNDTFVMKVHLLPLFVLQKNGEGDMILAVDAVETVRALRDDIQDCGPDTALLQKKEKLFQTVIEKIRTIGRKMGIRHIYAEKFSNTRWVREALNTFPEIFLHVDDMVKLDELEDVFTLSQQICKAAGQETPHELFMELQMKNTSLLPRLSERVKGVKPFAIIKGQPENGIQMKRVIGV